MNFRGSPGGETCPLSESIAAEGTTGSSYLDDLPADLDFRGQTVCERLNVKFAYFKLPGSYYDREPSPPVCSR